MPESAAHRYLAPMGLVLIDLEDAWSVRERYILVREEARMPAYAQSLIDLLCAHHQALAEKPARRRRYTERRRSTQRRR